MNVKKLIYVLVCLVLVTSFKPANDELKWYDWNEGYALAKKQGKIVLVDAYTDWCGWCKRMDRDTYANKDVIGKINRSFVPIKFNPEKQGITYDVDGQKMSPQELFAQFTRGEQTGFPTTYFILTKRKQIFLQAGYMDAANFMSVLDEVIKRDAQ